MSIWNISPIWKDEECFIIGGGNSLLNFDWNLLIGQLTIGCNNAFQLGTEICKVCIFGDEKWFKHNSKELDSYEGMVFTNVTAMLNSKVPYLNTTRRMSKGLHKHALGWNDNTGFSAINLALLFGASPIYLLGFDMKLSNGKHNWHDKRLDRSGAEVYRKFLRNQGKVAKDWREKFPNQQIFNVTDDSDLTCFPKVNVEPFWSKRQCELLKN